MLPFLNLLTSFASLLCFERVAVTVLPRDAVLRSQVFGCNCHGYFHVRVRQTFPQGVLQLHGTALEDNQKAQQH